ncbi:EamA-like transporter family protein [Litoreibacter ponti]|uniref:EamA-like transporter family protein n=1 Tax=Litoreibacter ponti TaxID=1510457 RepID=A0A2T6BI98_9RHOB|nr:DMT family transporter [Litoreibacter ponti]PTX55793.1 EamA-like transporter family protein [Litoreibacter ponti]
MDQPASNLPKAALWMLGAIASFSLMAVAGRKVGAELDTFELMTYRSFISIALVLGIGGMAGTLGQISTRNFKLHIARNVSHFAGQNLWFAAITMIPLAQVIALEFTSPIWVAILAPFFLSERLTRLRLFVAVLGFIGILIVARPDFANLELGAIFAAGSAIGFAGSAIFTKILTRHHSITCILFWLAVMQAVFGLVCAGYDGDIAWPSTALIPWVIIVSCTGLAAHFCLTSALTEAPAVTVMPLDFARLPVVALLGMLIFGEALDPFVFIGAAIIFGANYLNIAAEARRSRALT